VSLSVRITGYLSNRDEVSNLSLRENVVVLHGYSQMVNLGFHEEDEVWILPQMLPKAQRSCTQMDTDVRR
jgi:hypothetical protein